MDPIQGLQWVQNFYEQAWNRLIWFVAVLIGGLGIGLPIVIQWFQQRNFNKQVRDLKAEYDKQILESRNAASHQIEENKHSIEQATLQLRKEMEERFVNETSVLKAQIGAVIGSTYMVQAQLQKTNKRHAPSLISSITACTSLLPGKDFYNFASALNDVKNALGKDIIKSDFSTYPLLEGFIKNLVGVLSNDTHEGRYMKDVEEIDKLWNEAKVREPK